MRSSLSRRLNEQAVIDAVYAQGPLTRGELAALTGLSKPTVSSIVTDLAAAKLLHATGRTSGKVGRTAELYAVNSAVGHVVGVDLGGTKIRAALVSTDGALDRVHEVPTPHESEEAIVAALAEQGIEARGRDHEGAQFTGVWVEDRKIASIGIRVKRGVTKHGLAINVTNDLAPFEWAVACGLPGVKMTSVQREAKVCRADPVGCLRKDLGHRLAQELGLRQRIVTPTRLQSALDNPSIAA